MPLFARPYSSILTGNRAHNQGRTSQVWHSIIFRDLCFAVPQARGAGALVGGQLLIVPYEMPVT